MTDLIERRGSTLDFNILDLLVARSIATNHSLHTYDLIDCRLAPGLTSGVHLIDCLIDLLKAGPGIDIRCPPNWLTDCAKGIAEPEHTHTSLN